MKDPKQMMVFKWGLVVFMMAATTIPYIVHFLQTPAGHHYIWVIPPYIDDSLAYFAWAQQAANGHFIFSLKFTNTPHSPFLFHPLFLFAGWIIKLTQFQPGLILLFLKIIGVGLFFSSLFKYFDYLKMDKFEYILGSTFISLSSGFGWYIKKITGDHDVSSRLSADLELIDINTYWSLLWNPLFPYALCLIILIIFFLDRGTSSNNSYDGWLCGAATFILVLLHPYHVPLITAVVASVSFFRLGKNAAPFLLRWLIISLPSFLYLFLVSVFHPIASQHSVKGQMVTPSFLSIVTGMGLPGILILWGASKNIKLLFRNSPVFFWLILSISMAYLPFWFQRKILFSAHLPVCILSAMLVNSIILKSFKSNTKIMIITVIAVLSAPTNFSLFLKNTNPDSYESSPYYLNDDLWRGLHFLKYHSLPEETVFSTVSTGRLIPGFSGNNVLAGHGAQSVDVERKMRDLNNIFNNDSHMDNKERGELFWQGGISYFFLDGKFKLWFENINPQWLVLSSDVLFKNNSVIILKRKNGPN